MENLLKDYSNEEVLKALKIVTELKLEREQGDLPEFIRGRVSEVSEDEFDLIAYKLTSIFWRMKIILFSSF